MEHNSLPHLNREWQRLQRHGSDYQKALFQLRQRFPFSTSAIRDFGALCMDVHYGPEVIALDPFDPHPFYISEKSNEAYTQAILNEHAQTNPNIQLIKKSPEKTITQVSRNGILGLIAWTNIFYDRLDADRLTFIAKQASPILHQDGIFIASAFDAGQAHHPTLRPAFEIAAQQLKTDPNCRFTLMITQQTTLGEYFLIGQPR